VNRLCTTLLLVLVCFCVRAYTQAHPLAAAQVPSAVPTAFFEMNMHDFHPWALVSFDGVRLWNTGTHWADLNPSKGVYNWTRLDGWISAAQAHGATEIIYTIGMTPQWASSNPNDQSCRFGPGQCAPPNDLNADGTGTNEHWKNFVKAIATHVGTKVRFWEIWNEPVMSFYWTGTFAQMVRMAKDARTIILGINPNARFLTPPNGANIKFAESWWIGYAEAGGLQYADIIAMHGYVNLPPHTCGNYPQAANFVTEVNNLRTILANYGQSYKSIWDTESSWGQVGMTCFSDPDLQTAFLGQFYMFHRSMNVKRLYWYAYDDLNTGQLYDPTTGTLLQPGIALQQVHQWMLGHTMVQNCASVGTVWTCGFTGPGGYVAESIWNTAKSCSGGVCQTGKVTVANTFTRYRTLSGKTFSISNHAVPVGAKPIFLDNQ